MTSGNSWLFCINIGKNMQKRLPRNDKYVEILDTTLRDGEQTPGVSFSPVEKEQLARVMLQQVRVDRMEIGSARVSDGEKEAIVNIISRFAQKGLDDRFEILGFVDGGKSVDWICGTGAKVINLLCKGSERHCRVQLKKEPAAHWVQVGKEIEYALERGLTVNVYLEDWSGGMRENFAYVYNMTREILKYPVARVMLPDTLGILYPQELDLYLSWMYSAFPDIRLDFHGHNDYGLVSANSLAAVKMGVNAVHVTVNGLGERTGNQTLSEIVPLIHDLTDRKTHIAEKQLHHASQLVQTISGKRISWNTPVVGPDVFTQTCGVHADGDKKGNLYANALLPERFNRSRCYALGKLSGKASIDKNLELMGLELDGEVREKVLREVVRLGDKKKSVTPDDLPFIIADVMRRPMNEVVKFVDYGIYSKLGVTPYATIAVEFKGERLEAESHGDGGYDAFMKALRKALKKVGVTLPRLLDYEVRIPPGGKTDALVETTITWDNGAGAPPLVTIGIDSDQIVAAMTATEKMINLLYSEKKKS